MSPLTHSGEGPSARLRLTEIAERAALASDCGEIQSLLHLATLALGAERSFFASMSDEGQWTRYAFVLDCDASWWHRYRTARPLSGNPWLSYAARHSTTIRATQLGVQAPELRSVSETDAAGGFASALLVPAHSGPSDGRASVLCFGHSVVGYFEDAAFDMLQVAARSLAMELHEWWARHERQRLVQRTRLTDADVRLLKRHCAGLSSKQIANELQVSCESVNSRFQRIIAKLGVRNRRAAARVAVECGLIIL